MKLKRKYLVGKEYKGIKRTKSDHQPGKFIKTGRFSKMQIPYKGKKYRIPTSLPGTPNGRCIRSKITSKKSANCNCGGCGVE